MGRPKEERREVILRSLEAAGVREREAVADVLAELASLPIVVVALPRVIAGLRRVGSPRRAANTLADAVAALEEQRSDASPIFVSPALQLLLQLSGASRRAARALAADPQLVVHLGETLSAEDPNAALDYPAALSAWLKADRGTRTDTEAFDRSLRRFRKRQLLRLAALELRDQDVRRTAAELAELAGASVQAALTHHQRRLNAEWGLTEPPCAAAVMGMGKLGGRELNFSSDIDLIYFYDFDGPVQGGRSTHEYFVRLFKRVSQSVGRITDEGFVFRVDLDLRPEGRSGPLANSVVSAERYYQTWGRTWERFAWIRARAIAGDPELGARITEMMRPFVYRRSLDMAAIEELVDMKAQLDEQTKKPRGEGIDLKLGSGGIREVEFFVQALQLLHGGRHRQLREVNTLDSLQALSAAGLISERMRETLSDVYLLLRKVEHRVQIIDEAQTHELPDDPEVAEAVARSMGFASGPVLRERLRERMAEVFELFSALLARAGEREPIPPQIGALLDPSVDPADKRAILAEEGCEHPEAALSNLDSCVRIAGGPWHPRAPAAEAKLGKQLLLECLQSPNADRALRHLPGLGRRLGIHRQYLAELGVPRLRRGVARVLGASDHLARILVSSPELLSRVLSAGAPPELSVVSQVLEEQLAELGGEAEPSLIALRRTKQEEILHTAVSELSGALEGAAVSTRLSGLAELLVALTLELARADTTARYGAPEDPEADLVVLAGGTLGAREMGYLSDVDLSMVYTGGGQTTGGPRGSIGLPEYYTRLAQRFLSFLSMRSAQGVLYDIDVRLRPSGSQGALVVNLDNFMRYHERKSQLWERQALLRTRPIAGKPALQAQVGQAILQAAYEAPIPADAGAQIEAMRARIQAQRAKESQRRGARLLDLKLGSGGLVEVEFLAQYLQLSHGAADPSLRTTSTREALARLGAAGHLEASEAQRLISAHDRLRTTLSWLRVVHDRMLDHVDLASAGFRALALALGYQGARAQDLFERDLTEDRLLVHEVYHAILRPDGPGPRHFHQPESP